MKNISYWVFGTLTLFAWLTFLYITGYFIASLPILVISMLLLPPIRQFFYLKTKKQISFNIKSFLIWVMIILFGILAVISSNNNETRESEKREQEQVKKLAEINKNNIDYFNINRKKIIEKAKMYLANKSYQETIKLTDKYLVTKDKELQQINYLAKTEMILTRLKTISSEDYIGNKKLYKQLVSLNPENTKYKEMLDSYLNKIKLEAIKKEKNKIKKKKIEESFSAWDGSHIKLAYMIKKNMNDPDSYKHDETVYVVKGDYLIVTTAYRGRNGFGGIVRETIKVKINIFDDTIQVLNKGY